MDFLNAFLTVVLVIVSIVLILVVLMQRGSANGGLGSAMGGGMAESAFGAETSNVLSKSTRNVAIVFFVMIFGLYLGRLWVHEHRADEEGGTLPEFQAEEQSSAANALEELISNSEEDGAAEETDKDAADVAEDTIPAVAE